MKRPLLIVALLYATGIVAGDLIPLSPWLLLAVSLGLAVLALAWDRRRSLLLYPLLFFSGWTNHSLHTAILSPHDLRVILGQEAAIVMVRGVLCETPTLRVYQAGEEESWRTLARIEVSALRPNKQDWQPAVGRMAVTTPGTLTNLCAGQTVEITGVAALPKIAVAEGTFDYRAFLKEQGIYYQLQAANDQDWQILRAPRNPPLADRFRAWGQHALALGLPDADESLRLEWALTLGWKTALTEEVSEPFIRAATYHIFAVDGLRMAIIFGIFFTFFRVLGLPRGVIGLILLPLLWFYVALTGWPASAIRATVMLSVIIGSWVLKRPSEMLNSLFVAAVIILVWQPQQLFQAGFQLSFLVVLCLIVMLPPLIQFVQRLTAADPLLPVTLRRHWPGFVRVPTRYAADVLVTSFAAWVGSIPLVAYYFHILTPVSTPANLVAVPLCGLVLASNLASLLLASWFPAAAVLFNHAGWFVMDIIRVTSHWFADWPAAWLYVPAPSLLTSILYYLLLFGIVTGWLAKPHLRTLKVSAVIVAGSLWCCQAWQEYRVTRLTILPVNGGTALYFDAPGKQNDWLIDSGPTNAVRLITVPFLRAQGVNRLTSLLLSHGDSHHIGGVEMFADLLPVNQVCASPVRFRSPGYRRAMNRLSQTPGLVRTVSRDDRLGAWTVLHPAPEDRFPQADDNALVLAGAVGGTRVLLVSDLGRLGQNALLERMPDSRADIVVTGLPTASEALNDALLDALQPRLIIVADSEFPASERASAKLRDRLAQRNVPVVYTRQAGAATLEFRRQQWELRTMSGTRLKSPPPG
jgi:competence protein ComEC